MHVALRHDICHRSLSLGLAGFEASDGGFSLDRLPAPSNFLGNPWLGSCCRADRTAGTTFQSGLVEEPFACGHLLMLFSVRPGEIGLGAGGNCRAQRVGLHFQLQPKNPYIHTPSRFFCFCRPRSADMRVFSGTGCLSNYPHARAGSKSGRNGSGGRIPIR